MTDIAKSDQPTGDQRLIVEAEERCNGYLRKWLEVSEFRDALRRKKEPLGTEFERVLHDNIWQLYAR